SEPMATPSYHSLSVVDPAFAWYGSAASCTPDRCALATPQGELTWSELLRCIEQEQARLLDAGHRRGHRLLLAGPPPGSIPWLATLLAGLNLGLQLVVPDQDWPAERIPQYTAALMDEAGADDESARPAGVWLFTSGTTATPRPRFRSLVQLNAE